MPDLSMCIIFLLDPYWLVTSVGEGEFAKFLQHLLTCALIGWVIFYQFNAVMFSVYKVLMRIFWKPSKVWMRLSNIIFYFSYSKNTGKRSAPNNLNLSIKYLATNSWGILTCELLPLPILFSLWKPSLFDAQYDKNIMI